MAAPGTPWSAGLFLWKHGLNGSVRKAKHVCAWDPFVCMCVWTRMWTYMCTCRLRHPPPSHTASTLPHCLESESRATTTRGHMGILQALWATLSPRAGFVIPMKSFLSPGLNSCPFLSPIQPATRFWVYPQTVLTAQVLELASRVLDARVYPRP